MNSLDRLQSYRRPLGSAAEESTASAFLWTTYRWMSLGLAVTGLTAWFAANSAGAMQLIFGNRMVMWGLFIAQIGVVLAFQPVATRVSSLAAGAMFLFYSALTGLTMSAIFMVYTQASIAQTFFVSSASFAGLAVFGATTKRDLTGVGRFMMMGLIGLIIASVVNIFFNNPAIYWVSTYAGVLIFAGLTAYDTQKLKEMYISEGGSGNLALRGALIFYLDFINLFLMLLRLFGSRRD